MSEHDPAELAGCLFYGSQLFFLYSHLAAAVASRQSRTVSESYRCKI
jgi:hypothetical protein